VAEVDLDVPAWIKFVTTLESLYRRCDPQRLPEDTDSDATVFRQATMMMMMTMMTMMNRNWR